MTALIDCGLPASPDIEGLVLGWILLNGERYPDIAAALSDEDWSLEKHRRIWARMRDLYDHGEGIDRVTVATELKRQGQLESVDGMAYLSSLDQGLPNLPSLDSYLRILKDRSLLRQTMSACQHIIDQCSLAAEPSEQILQTAEGFLDRIRNNANVKLSQWITPGDILGRGIDAVLFPAHGGAGMKTPWPYLTDMTSGWHRGDLIVVAGRPGMGKSVIGMQQAHTSAKQGIGVAYFSLEMTSESLVQRLVAGISRVDSHRIRSGCVDKEERRRMLEAANDVKELPLFIDDSRARTPAAVSAALRKLRVKADVGLIVVDHLQLMKTTGRAESKHQELSEICHGFKHLAGQTNCVVMLLSQLNRSCELEKRRPRLSDLKESGSIEEDADTVAFIHRQEMFTRDDPSLRGKAELIVGKQRAGPTGKINLTFLHGYQVFEQAARERED